MFIHTNKSIRKLICSDCGKYLSVTPIKVKTNGLPICGRCEAENCDKVNVPLTTIVKSVQFPCCNDRYGCTTTVNWENALEHEKSCKHAQNEDERISTLQFNKIDEINCDNCKNLINVSPIYLKSDDKFNCGRCPTIHIQEEKDSTTRQIFLEVSFSHLRFPCKYGNQGCKKLLAWGQVEMHELLCKWRNVSCPSIPFGNCDWLGPFTKFDDHIQQLHHEMVMDEQSIKLDLQKDIEITKLFSYQSEMFLLSLKVYFEEKIVWACVRYLGDSRLAANFRFKMMFTDENGIEEIASKKKDVGTNIVLNLVKAESVSTKINTILAELGGSNMVLCSVKISKKNKDVQENCQNDFCDHVGNQKDAFKHRLLCPLKTISCRWYCGEKFINLSDVQFHHKKCAFGWPQEVSLHYICKREDEVVRMLLS